MKCASFKASMGSLVILWLIFMSIALGQDAVPKLINYQGKLTDATGITTLANGEYSVKFELYDAATEGTLVWGETRTVTLVGGIFNVALGGAGSVVIPGAAVNDIGFAFGSSERFLQTIIVSGPGVSAEQTLLPRQQMASVPFALMTEDSSLLKGKAPTAYYTPPGAVLAFAGPSVPEGYLPCNGESKSVDDFPDLFSAIGYTYGGSGNTFMLPNYEGRFLRGLNGNSGLDPGRIDFTTQGDNIPNHRHLWGSAGTGDIYSRPIRSYNSAGTRINILTKETNQNQTSNGGGNNADDFKTVSVADNTSFYTAPNSTIRDGGEVRPVNASVNYIIKY